MVESDNLRFTRIPLNNGSGAIPALGFGTLIPDPMATRTATKAALEAGFRVIDTAERYRTEREIGEAMQGVFEAGRIKREDVFVITKLWNTNHRPERVKPAFEASLKKLQLDYVDLYLIHTPFAFQAGDEQDPRDANGNVIYDQGVTLLDTWSALEQPGGRRQVQGDRIIQCQSGPDARDLRSDEDQARCGSRRITPISPAMGTFELLQNKWHRAASVRRAGA